MNEIVKIFFQVSIVCGICYGVSVLNRYGKRSLSGLLSALPLTSSFVLLFSATPESPVATIYQSIACASGFVPGVAFSVTFLVACRNGWKMKPAFICSFLFCLIAVVIQYEVTTQAYRFLVNL